jgi:hypothetical protein
MTIQINKYWKFTEINDDEKYTLPPGKYYIGDIYYPLSESKTYYDIYYENGLYENYKGELILVDSTFKGDGTFLGSDNNEYMVDSKTFGILSYSLCLNNNCTAGGHVYSFISPITVEIKDGIFKFNSDEFNLIINTEINIEDYMVDNK